MHSYSQDDVLNTGAICMSIDDDIIPEDYFKRIQSLIHKLAGISIPDRKRQLVHNRIDKRIKTLYMSGFSDYMAYLDQDQDELVHLVNALTTNVTHFFREKHHFDHLKAESNSLVKSGKNKLRIWSAGCSIGAEPYSAALMLHEEQLCKSVDLKILATDIDTLALDVGRDAVYDEQKVRGLDKYYLSKYFTKQDGKDGKSYKLNASVRKLVSFNYFNLNTQIWPMKGPFDFIFCRNVFIYFERDKQAEFITKMVDLLTPGGFLYIGHSEHAIMESFPLKLCGQTIYQKPL